MCRTRPSELSTYVHKDVDTQFRAPPAVCILLGDQCGETVDTAATQTARTDHTARTARTDCTA